MAAKHHTVVYWGRWKGRGRAHGHKKQNRRDDCKTPETHGLGTRKEDMKPSLIRSLVGEFAIHFVGVFPGWQYRVDKECLTFGEFTVGKSVHQIL